MASSTSTSSLSSSAPTLLSPQKCLYVSGMPSELVGSWETACSPSVWGSGKQETWTGKYLKPRLDQLGWTNLDAPELDLKMRAIPLHSPGKYFVQRNVKSGKVRSGVYFDPDERKRVEEYYPRVFGANLDAVGGIGVAKLLEVLRDLGGVDVNAKVQQLIAQQRELDRQKEVIQQQIVNLVRSQFS